MHQTHDTVRAIIQTEKVMKDERKFISNFAGIQTKGDESDEFKPRGDELVMRVGNETTTSRTH